MTGNMIGNTFVPDLFQFDRYTLASGKESNFKIECDSINETAWHNLGRIVRPILPLYGKVFGVPNGGCQWADIFKHYVTVGHGRVLFVDDVWTTGKSMNDAVSYYRQNFEHYEPFLWSGVVLFARGPVPKHVTAVFSLHEELQ